MNGIPGIKAKIIKHKFKILVPLCLPGFFYLFLLLLPFPELDEFRARSYGTVITDRNGIILRVLPADDGVRREWASLDEIPPGAVKIFIRAEDRRFYFHPGVDVFSVARSFVQNMRAGRTVSGASTITMQLARIIRPHCGGYAGKIREVWDALRLEARLSKSEILELWLNNIPFGSNIEGLPAMARARFGRSIRELDENRAALLAPVPRRPAFFDPALNPGAAVAAALVLSERLNLGLRENDLWAAASETAGPLRMPDDARAPFFAPHFTERIRLSALHAGHHRFHSTLDLNFQRYAQEMLAQELSFLYHNRVSNGAVLAIENDTGAVRVYVGSACWFDDSVFGKIDGVRTRAQPGSCLKPFLYALAIDMGFTPADIMPDIPTIFGSREAYVPSNFNNRFNGPVRLRVALASSLNIPSVYILERIGLRAFEEYLINLGFDSIKNTIGTHGLGLALGNAEVSLEEMVRGFSVFPRLGSIAELAFKEGQNNSSNRLLMSEYAAWIITDILSDRPSRFMGFGPAPVMATPFESMFKTGTANQFQHIWALAATRRFTVGVWMGNFSGETVVGTTGSAIPASIAARLLAAMEDSAGFYNVSLSNFSPGPSNLAGPLPAGAIEQQICTLSGMAAGPHCSGRTQEWIWNDIKPLCDWHGPWGLFYPPEYQAWLAEGFRFGLVRQEGSGRIRTPVNGAVYFLNPSIPPQAQALRVETTGFSADALVYANGVLMGKLNHAGVFNLPLLRGFHTVVIEDPNGAFASVNFEVR